MLATTHGAAAGKRVVVIHFRQVALAMLVAFAWSGEDRACSQSVDSAKAVGGVGLPLVPARTVRFRVTEGTWMSLDVNSDGKTIVFDLLGDLYTLPVKGGTAHRLTSGMAFKSQPRFAPDGHRIAFISDQSGTPNLWIVATDGSAARQISALHWDIAGSICSPTWSPDGRHIVVAQRLAATRLGPVNDLQRWTWLLATYDVETGRFRWLSDTTATGARSTLGPAFSPDGRSVYAAAEPYLPPGARDPDDLRYQIERIDLLTGHAQTEIATLSLRGGMRPAVSPDGRYLAYASSSGSYAGLRLRSLKTGAERWLVPELLGDPTFSPVGDSRDLLPGYAFTPDGKSLIMAFHGTLHQIAIATGQALPIPFVVNVERKLGPLVYRSFTLPDTGVRTRSVMQPSLSPDGRRVAFSALDRIWIMDLPQHGGRVGRPRRLTTDSVGEFYPSWSPDGRWIAYSTWADGEGGALRRVWLNDYGSLPSAASERLTSDTALYFNTAIALNGKRVVTLRAPLPPERQLIHGHISASPRNLTLVWVPASGGLPREIVSPSIPNWPIRSPMEQVYVTDDSTRVHVGLASWRWDGSDKRVALTLVEQDSMPSLTDFTGVLSMDGRRALITHRSSLYEVSLPAESAVPATAASGELVGALTRELDKSGVAAQRWGTALVPWISWSTDGRRVLFAQGGSLFVGKREESRWSSFDRVDVPLTIPVDHPRGDVLLHGARLITMRGNEVIDRGDIVVRRNRIVQLGATGDVRIPAGARMIDLTGKTILPGYVDVHDHIALPDGVHPGQCWTCLLRLAFGVTALRDPWPGTMYYNDIFAYQERERAGDIIAPRLFTTGRAYFDGDLTVKDLRSARSEVRPYTDYFNTETFKLYYDPSGRGTRQLLAEALREVGLDATVEGAANAARDLTVVLDGYSGLEHLLPVRIYDDVAALIAMSGTVHTQTYGIILGWDYMFRQYGRPWEWAVVRRFTPPSGSGLTCIICDADHAGGRGLFGLDNLVEFTSGATRIVAKGGRVAIGSHGNLPGLGFHYEMWFNALGGMPTHEVLRAATLVGATAIGHERDFGSLEVGKLADLQVLDRNPLEDIHNTVTIRYVMKNGRLYRTADLAEMWPTERQLPNIYLWPADSSIN